MDCHLLPSTSTVKSSCAAETPHRETKRTGTRHVIGQTPSTDSPEQTNIRDIHSFSSSVVKIIECVQ